MSADPGDVGRYHDFATLIDGGKLPYRDFYFEYPPGALPAFLAPLGFGPVAGYNIAFKILVAVCGLTVLPHSSPFWAFCVPIAAGSSQRSGSSC